MPYLTAILFTTVAAALWSRYGWTGDELPVLVAFPLAVWLGWPWRVLSSGGRVGSRPAWIPKFGPETAIVNATPGLHPGLSSHVPSGLQLRSSGLVPLLILAAIAFITGTVFDLNSLQALAFTVALGWWLRRHLSPFDWLQRRTLLPLALLAFPWIAEDASSIGLAFRLSTAWVAEAVFSTAGFHIVRTGTLLHLEGFPVSVEPSCAGLHTLQAMLIAGVSLAHLRRSSTRVYVLSLLALPFIAWTANTLRILFLCVAALNNGGITINPTTHDLGGWAVIMVAFLAAWHLMEKLLPDTGTTQLRRA